MIYKKDANFPYPILTNSSSSYENSIFSLDVQLEENALSYRFDIEYEIDSAFLNQLLDKGEARLVLVIQSKDNKFFILQPNQSHIEIPKTRISVNKRTTIQLHLQANKDVSFADNGDLSKFYQSFKDQIIIPKHSILGFSNVVVFEGSTTKPLELFEKKVNPNLKSDIQIELGWETIIIHYRNEQMQFTDLPKSQSLNNLYVYMGLQKALFQFIVNNSDDGELVDIEHMEIPVDPLDMKLYTLLKKKMVTEVSMETIDEIIYAVSDRMLEKYTAAIKELTVNEH